MNGSKTAEDCLHVSHHRLDVCITLFLEILRVFKESHFFSFDFVYLFEGGGNDIHHGDIRLTLCSQIINDGSFGLRVISENHLIETYHVSHFLGVADSINQLFDSLFQNSFLLLNLVFLLSGITQIFASSFHLCDYLGHLLTSFPNVVFDQGLYTSSLLELILNYGILLSGRFCFLFCFVSLS